MAVASDAALGRLPPAQRPQPHAGLLAACEAAHDVAAVCETCAARLSAQRALGALSLLLSGVALATLAAAGLDLAGRAPLPAAVLAALAIALAAGLAERYLAVRLALDARLFAALAQRQIIGLVRLDAALGELALAPPAKAGRPLAPRLQGALRLARWHTGTVLLQLAALLAALLPAPF